MKYLIWVALFILVAAGVAGWSSYSGLRSPLELGLDRTAEVSPSPTSPSPVRETNEVEFPPVDTTKLWQHLEAVAGERYGDSDRAQVRNYLSRQLQAVGFSPSLQPFAGGVNLVAQRQGTDPQAGTILVGAHYDTVLRSPGVDDNATGVAAVLEVARLLGPRPTPRTLQIVFFDREETGLAGSFAFTSNGAKLRNLQAAVVLDMIGYACRTQGCQRYPEGLPVKPLLEGAGVTSPNQGEFIAVVGDAEHLPLLGTFPQSHQMGLPPVVAVPVPLKGILTPDVLRSDHAPFWYKGIGAVLVTDTANLRSPHYHQPSDTLATLDRPFFTGAVQVVVNATAKLLESHEALENRNG
ncbi:MAG: M28 family peptidase [Actinomycetota bacterium]